MLRPIIAGAIIMGSWSIALFFLRFFRQTRDRLFAYFAMAFFLVGIERIVMLWNGDDESNFLVHVIRVIAFLLIVFAIINKNRTGQKRRS